MGTTGSSRQVHVSLTAATTYFAEVRYVSGTSTYTLQAGTFEALGDPVHLDTRAGDGSVAVGWMADSEERIVEYALVRSVGASGTFESLADPVPAQAPLTPQTASYSWMDTGVVNGTTYYYRLDVRSPDGDVFHIGPIGAKPGVSPTPDAGCSCRMAPGDLGAPVLVLIGALVGGWYRLRRAAYRTRPGRG